MGSAEPWLISDEYDEPEPASPSRVGERTRITGAAGVAIVSILATWKRPISIADAARERLGWSKTFKL